MKWLASHKDTVEAARRNLTYIAEYGRYDDLYCLVDTLLEAEMFAMLKEQLALDMQCKTPSLLAKWLKSENTSSAESRALGNKTRLAFGMTHKQYRKTLSILRERINLLERLMSENRWDEIEFDKIPSRAGMIYRNAFARRDIIKAKYEAFAKSEDTKVNAKTLYPYECVTEARRVKYKDLYDTDRLMVNKYWANLADYIQNGEFNGMAVVDTSGSMCGPAASAPINVAISLGLYCAEKAKGPYANHFLTFESNPHFIEVVGADFVEKVTNIMSANWGGSTNIEAAFDLMLDIALKNKCSQDEIPQNLIVISDMEFNSCVTSSTRTQGYWGPTYALADDTLFETMKKKWTAYGYKMPRLYFWNVDARQDNVPMKDEKNVTYVSGFSPVIFEQIIKGKTAQDLMFDKLDSERYAVIH